MAKNPDILKKALLSLIFSYLFIHMVHDILDIPKIPPLKGDVTYPKKPSFMMSSWFLGNYQKQQDEYLNAMFGLRSMYVRLNNQIDFSLFKKANAKYVVIGKENYLYEKKYIDAFYGADFMGMDSVDHILNQAKFISDELKKRGKELIIILAPDKASFYPEFIPDEYKRVNDSTNYKFFSKGLNDLGLSNIDFHKWFIENKNRSKYPLYPLYGIHWSIYGSVLAADSIINYIQKVRNIDMPNLSYDTVDMKRPFGVDYDVANGMNLLLKFKSPDMAYARIHTQSDEAKVKPNVLVVSDSFFWQMYYFGFQNSFNVNHFWYYNHEVYPESTTNKSYTRDLDLAEQINDHDVFIVMASQSNLSQIGWGFFKNLESMFNGNWDKINFKKKLFEKKSAIKKDKSWMIQIKKKANEKKISIDSMITLDAIWVLEHD